MNVLHINGSDLLGGAAIAGYRLHEGLLSQGIESRLLVGDAVTGSDRVALTPRNPRIEKQTSRLAWRLGLNYINLFSTFKIRQHPFYQSADILNFHSLHGGYFNYLAIPSLTENKPAVWTLHDMWAFTGHCSYSYDCERWKTGCGKCPYPDTYPAIKRDSTRLEWKLKKRAFDRSKLAIVSPSRWLAGLANESLLGAHPVSYIPNGLDTEVFKPLDAEECRLKLGIARDKKVLMFGAQTLSDTRKGGDLMLKALQSLPASLKAETMLLTIGQNSETIAEAVDMQVLNLGYVDSDELKATAYSAADLFIFPTRSDNLPLVLQESMACGTPMVSFKVGGVPELVRPGITGYLARAEDVEDFRNGIVELLSNNMLLDDLGRNCRTIAVEEYSVKLQAERYLELYSEMLRR
mgnify:CR=1 FL=1